MSANLHTLRLAGAVLCATASLLLVAISLYLFMGEGTSLGAVLLLLVGLGLLGAAAKSFRWSEPGYRHRGLPGRRWGGDHRRRQDG